MSIIALVSGIYCSGDEIAKQLAERLEYDLVSGELAEDAAQKFGTTVDKLNRAMSGDRALFNIITHDHEKSVVYLKAALAELGVDFVLEGSARKDTARTRITLQLINAQTDQHLWVQEYDRELSSASLLDIQDDIARRVVGALRARISSIERGRISGRRTESGAAHQLYLRATQLDWGARTENQKAPEGRL